ANPQHSNKFAKEFEDQHNKWKQDEEFQKLSPREQYQKMAEFQKQHWEDNPDHVDEFVSSGKERNAYANATKLLREGKIKGEEEDIAQGGAGVSSDMTGHAAQQHIGTSSGDEDAGGPNIQQNPTAKISGGNPTAARIFAQEQEQKKQSIKDMIGHNATNDPNNPIHTERLDRLKGMQPDIKAAQDIVGSVADKHKDIREQDIQQKLKEHQARGFVDTKSPKEQLSAEYLPKMNTMAEKLINSTGTKGKIEPIDLIQAGQQGLWEAARDFNPKVHNFKGLAARRIKARMRDVLKAQIGVSKPTQERIKMLEEAKRNMQSKLRPQEGDE
ncbi:hypothetical protein KY315_04050, partial [Candidatus Woesearchaeota archaeon]|nr:hypothetical protein [Candidatus Woesearchaeota archaeon]